MKKPLDEIKPLLEKKQDDFCWFDPKKDLYSILKLPQNERKVNLSNYKKNLEKYYIDLAKLLKEIVNNFLENPDFEIWSYLKNNEIYNFLPEEVKDIFLTRIYCYLLIKEKNKKLYNLYKDNVNELIFYFFRKRTSVDIDFNYKWWCLIFIFPDKESFLEVYKDEWSNWFYSSKEQIIVTYKQNELERIIDHEMQHFVNNMVFNIPNIVPFNTQILKDNLSLVWKYKILKIVDNLFKSYEENFFILKDEILARIKWKNLFSSDWIKKYFCIGRYCMENRLISLIGKISSIDIDIKQLRYYFDINKDFQKQEKYARTLLILFDKIKSKYPDNYLELLSVLNEKQLWRLVGLKNKVVTKYKRIN